MKRKRFLSSVLFCVMLMVVLISGSVTAGNVEQIGLNQSVQKVGTSREADVYQINVTTQGKLNVNLKHENLFDTEIYWTVEVLADDLETVIQTFDSVGTDTNLSGPSLGLSSGTYYIKVWSRKSCSHSYSSEPYTLTPKFTPSTSWEIEYNAKKKSGNSMQGSASPAKVGKKAYGTLGSSTDVDFYKIKVNKNGYITLNFKHANVYKSEICWKVALVNSKTSEICSIESKGTQKSVTTSKIGVTKGTYYIKVEAGNSFDTADYTVTPKFVSTNNWEKEYTNSGARTNNSMSSANPISFNKKIGGTISNDSDVDFYTFKLSSTRNVKIQMTHSYKAVRKKYWKVQVFNSKLKEVGSFTSKGVDRSMAKTLTLKKGTYFVKISKANKLSTLDYGLTIK